jgi:Xaa-Pro aminopeptidase
MTPARGITLKSNKELAIMREAGRVNALALQAAKAAIRPGATTAEVDAAAAEVLKKHGAKAAFLGYGNPPYPAVTCVSVNEELVHGIPGKRRIQEGDLVSVDCGAIVEGYVGDAAFTVAVGEPDDLQRRLMEAAERALQAAIGEMRPGRKVGDVSAAMQRCTQEAGFFIAGAELHETRDGRPPPTGHDDRAGADGAGRHDGDKGRGGPLDGRLRRRIADDALRTYGGRDGRGAEDYDAAVNRGKRPPANIPPGQASRKAGPPV